MSETAALADGAVATVAGMKLDAEVYLEDNLVFSAAVTGGKVESLETKEELGAGIRVFSEGRVGFAYTSDLSPEGVREAAAAASALAAHTDPELANRLPRPEPSPLPPPDPGDLTVEQIAPYKKVALARAMEEAARAADARLTKVRRARYTDVVGRVELRTTAGFAAGAPFGRVLGSIEVVAEQAGEAQSGYASDFSLRFAGLDPFRIGREAARRAVAKLGAARAATRRAAVVLDPEVTASLLDAFAPALAADAVLKGKSLLAGRVGQTVASSIVTLVDDGRFPGGNRTFPFDGEGFATRRTILVDGGVLRGFLQNAYTAARLGVAPSGNAFRSSYMTPPRIGPTTLYLLPLARSPESILAEAGDGLLVTEVMGLHTVDTITGEFSLGASGHLLRGGEAGTPVTGVGIAGTLQELLQGITAVGSDLRLFPGGTAGSTILIRQLSVSGT